MPANNQYRFIPVWLHATLDTDSWQILDPFGWVGCVALEEAGEGGEEETEEKRPKADPVQPDGHLDLASPLAWDFAVRSLYAISIQALWAGAPEPAPLLPVATSVVFTPVSERNPYWLLGPADALVEHEYRRDECPCVYFYNAVRPPPGVLLNTYLAPYLPRRRGAELTPEGRWEALCRCFAAVLKIDVDATWPPLPADPADTKEEE